MKSFKQLTESNGYIDISYMFPDRVMNAYIVKNRNALAIMAVPDDERQSKYLNIPIKFTDYSDDTIVVLKGNYNEVFYWIIKDYGWELFDYKGTEMHDVPYRAVKLNKIYKRLKNEIL